MKRHPFVRIALVVSAAALSCASPPQSAFPQSVTDGYRSFANGDCTAVRVQARAIDETRASLERDVARLLLGYCFELEGDTSRARSIYSELVAGRSGAWIPGEAVVRLRDLEDLERGGVTRAGRERMAEERRKRSPVVPGQIPPRVRVDPRYPPALVAAGVEGWVIVDLGITRDGTVVDPLIVSSDPRFVFDRTLLDAVRTWSYEPHDAEGDVRVLVKHVFEIAR